MGIAVTVALQSAIVTLTVIAVVTLASLWEQEGQNHWHGLYPK